MSQATPTIFCTSFSHNHCKISWKFCGHSLFFLSWSFFASWTGALEVLCDFLSILIGLPSHLSTAVAWREKKVQAICLLKYFCLVLGLLESRISEKTNEGLGRKPNLGQPMSMKDHFGLKILHIMFMKCEILEGDVNPIPSWMVAVWAKLS